MARHCTWLTDCRKYKLNNLYQIMYLQKYGYIFRIVVIKLRRYVDEYGLFFLQDDLEVTKSELVDVQKQNSQFRNDIDSLTEQLDREQKLHEDAVAEVSLRLAVNSG